MRRNVLILHSGALGDFVVSWPLVLALGRTQPQSRIIVVTSGSKGKLAEAALRVESADIEAGWQGLYADGGEPKGPAEKLVRGAREIYSFASREGDLATENLRRWSGADVVCVVPRPSEGEAKHVGEFLAEQVAQRAVIGVAVKQMLASIADRGLGFGGNPGGDVVVHPGSGAEKKNWAREKFMELVKRLRDGGRKVRVLVGEVEQEKWAAGEVEKFTQVAEVRRPRDYVELFSELKSAEVVVANDSGPGHLAGMMGLPTVSIFKATDPRVWRPLGPRVKMVQGKGLDEVTVGEVYDAVVGEWEGKRHEGKRQE